MIHIISYIFHFLIWDLALLSVHLKPNTLILYKMLGLLLISVLLILTNIFHHTNNSYLNHYRLKLVDSAPKRPYSNEIALSLIYNIGKL